MVAYLCITTVWLKAKKNICSIDITYLYVNSTEINTVYHLQNKLFEQ